MKFLTRPLTWLLILGSGFNVLEDEQAGGVESGGGNWRQETAGKPWGMTTCNMRPLREGTIIEVQTTDSERFPNVYAPILPFPFISRG
jgi:hypothetical protein